MIDRRTKAQEFFLAEGQPILYLVIIYHVIRLNGSHQGSPCWDPNFLFLASNNTLKEHYLRYQKMVR